jgi:hypothetical protein
MLLFANLLQPKGSRSPPPGNGGNCPFTMASAKLGDPPSAAGADFVPANPPKQLSKLIIDYRLS